MFEFIALITLLLSSPVSDPFSPGAFYGATRNLEVKPVECRDVILCSFDDTGNGPYIPYNCVKAQKCKA